MTYHLGKGGGNMFYKDEPEAMRWWELWVVPLVLVLCLLMLLAESVAWTYSKIKRVF